MNKNKLKTYAPQARNDFVAAVKARAALLGISEAGVSPATKTGDVVIVEGREWPTKVGVQRERLAAKIGKEGFEAVMDRVAYTWFNRFAALRFMELHDYLGHGHRVLSNREGGLPEILFHAGDVDLPGLNKAQVVELRLAGDRDGDLYRMLLVAQCNALSAAMPFLFERIDDESELLLPDNLLRTDSVAAKMVSSIDEDDWSEVEILGWLYQFYISEKKDEVMGQVVKSADIPAATQLFTPNWIVKYLVQNSVGRLWLMANPSSPLRSKWKYFVEPAAQSPETQEEIDSLVCARVGEDGGKLSPESITVLDPACGSGHILVEAYDLLKDVYLERGYQPRAIPRLILEHNLFGLDIDDRAAQLAGFALLMKARADDRRLFQETPGMCVLSLQESKRLSLDEIDRHLKPFGVERGVLARILSLFADAKTIGSLVIVDDSLRCTIPELEASLTRAQGSGDVFAKAAADDLLPLIRQAKVIAGRYDSVVANPPYMGNKGMNATLKDFGRVCFPNSKTDLFSMFIERAFKWCKASGFNSMVAMQSWMFLSSFETLRAHLLQDRTILTMAHLGPRAFAEISGEVVQTAAFVMQTRHFAGYKPVFFRLIEGQEEDKRASLLKGEKRFDGVVQDDFAKIPGMPVAYWVSETLRKVFSGGKLLGTLLDVKQGLATADNDRFLRYWPEVSQRQFGSSFATREDAKLSGKKWFPHSKGGEFKKWYGNREWLVNWEQDGIELFEFRPRSVIRSPALYFKESLTWSLISGSNTAFRFEPQGNIIGHKGPGIFGDKRQLLRQLTLLNSCVAVSLLKILSPTLGFEVGQVAQIPVLDVEGVDLGAVQIAKEDWDSFETSWDFLELPWLGTKMGEHRIADSWGRWNKLSAERFNRLKSIEEGNNRLYIDAYGLQDELSPEVPEEQITLTRADRGADSKRLLSYAIGCMMGRYSLDEPGLIYANEGNLGFEPDRYRTFPADADGILPLTDELWFEDDSTLRVVEFLRAVWGRDTSDENMEWVADSLGKKNGETAEESVRRYLSASFYKDHLQTYKKRPIYWLFSSGKQKAFEALVYLHRYHEGTLARMRSEYVVPLLSKYLDRIELLGRDAEAAGSAAARTKIQKRIDALRKKHHELVAFEEKLRHMADSRIRLDLDDGVKVNYAKFGDLLAETKAVTGGAED